MGETRFVVPFGREGAADRAARAFSRALGRISPGCDLVFENLPGSGGLTGVERANELASAGRPVMLLGTPSTHILMTARRGREAGPGSAFEAVLGLGSAPNVLLVSPALGIRSVEELIAGARAQELVYASAGTGQTIHVCTALFCTQADIAMKHRPYDSGSATAYGDLAAGRVHVFFDNLLGCRDRIEAGEAVPLAVSSVRRNPLLPEVPTLIERGFADHALDVWLGVFGANLDAGMHAGARAAANDAALAAELRAQGLSGGLMSAHELVSQVARSISLWTRALRAT